MSLPIGDTNLLILVLVREHEHWHWGLAELAGFSAMFCTVKVKNQHLVIQMGAKRGGGSVKRPVFIH